MSPHVVPPHCTLLEWLPPPFKALSLLHPLPQTNPTVPTHHNAALPENGHYLRSHASSEHRLWRSGSSWKPLLPLSPPGIPACHGDVSAPVTGSSAKLARPGTRKVRDWCYDLHPLCPQPSSAWQLWLRSARPGKAPLPKMSSFSVWYEKKLNFSVPCHAYFACDWLCIFWH